MASIYLSYQPGDSNAAAGRLHDFLSERFGDDAVRWRESETAPSTPSLSRGVDTGQADADFLDAVVVIVLIGPQWLQKVMATEPDAQQNPVRRELTMALARRLPVIAVLAQGAAMPQAPYLPPALQPLANLEPLPLRNDPDFHRDAERLEVALSHYLTPLADTRGVRRASVSLFALLAGLALLVIALGATGVVFAARSNIGIFTHGPRATPTATAVVQRTPTLVTIMNDPLTARMDYGALDSWLVNVAGHCAFAAGGYQVIGSDKVDFVTLCAAPKAASTGNERLSITTRLTSDDNPQGLYGLYLHATDEAVTTGYEFAITPASGWVFRNARSGQSLDNGTSSAIHTGPGAVNTLTVDILDGRITLSVNGARVGQITDTSYTAGACGVLVEHGLTVVYTNFTVQRYS